MALRPQHALHPAVAPSVERLRLKLADGAETTVYVVRHDTRTTGLRVVRLPHPEPLAT